MGNGGTITVSVEALTDEANAKIKAFFATLNAGAKITKEGDKQNKEKTKSLDKLKETSALARESFEGLQSAVLLLGGPHLALLSQGVQTARMGMNSLRSAAKLSGVELALLGPILGGVAAVVATGVIAWKAYQEEMQEAGNRALETAEKIKTVTEFLQQLNALRSSGAISPGRQGFLEAVLRGKGGSYTGSVSPADAALLERLEKAGVKAPRIGETYSPEALKKLQDYLMRQGLLVPDENREKPGVFESILTPNGPKSQPAYVLSPAVEAMQKLRDMRMEMRNDYLTGDEKEVAELAKKYQDLATAVKLYGEAAVQGGLMSRQRLESDLKEVAALESAAIGRLDMSQQFEKQKKADQMASEAFDKRQAELAADAKRQQEELERKLTLDAAREGKTRQELFEQEYEQRMRLIQELYYSGTFTEKEYTAAVDQAVIQRLEARKAEAERAIQLQNAQSEIELARIQGQRQLLSMNPDLTLAERKAKLLELLREENRLLEENINLQRRRITDMSMTPEARMAASKQLQELEQRRSENIRNQGDVGRSGTFAGEARKGIVELNNDFGNLGGNAAKVALDSMRDGVRGVSNAITDAIYGTQSWAEAWASIGRAAVSSMIEMLTQYVASKLAMMAVDAIYHKKSQAQAAATTVSSGTAGVAQAGAQGGWVGVLIYMGVFAAAVAAISAIAAGVSGAYAKGGRPVPGEMALVGEQGPELFVPDGPGTVLTASQTAAVMSGKGGRGGAASGTGGGSTRVVIVSDERKLRDMQNNPEFENIVVNLMKKNQWRFA